MRHPRLSLLTLLIVLLSLGAPAGASAATLSHPLLETINGGYEDACGIAFNSEGLFVSDYYHDRIVGPNGTIANEDPSGGPCKLAFDASGDLYVNNRRHDVVRYDPSEIPSGPGEVIDSARPTGLAVDRATGDLFVAHRTYVSEYEAPVKAGDAPVATIGLGHLGEAYGLAISEYPATNGYLYVADAADNRVKVFDPAGSLIEEMNGAATPQGHFTYFVNGELAVDNSPESPSYGHLYVLDAIGHGTTGEAVIDEFNAAGDYRAQIAGFTDAEPSGVAIVPSGSNAGKVYVTSGNTEESLVLVYGPTAPAFTLTATKSGAGGGTVSTSPSGIVCGPACAAEYAQEERVTLVAIPDPRSEFTGWTVTGPGAEPCPGTGTCSLLLFGDTEVSANFEPAPLHKLEVSVAGQGSVSSEPAGISCSSGTCAEEFAENLPVVLTAAPAAHNEVAQWSGCDSVPQADVCDVTMSAAKAVSVAFASIPQLSLSVAKTGTGQGTVTSYLPGVSCPGSCSASFDEGSTVYLMAAPSPGSGFAGFSGGGCAGTATLCAVPMSSAQNVTATFTGSAAGPAGGSAASSASASLALASVRTAGNTAVLSLRTSEAGTLVAGGPGLEPLKRKLPAGAMTLRLHLGPAARKGLERRGHLALRLSLGFLPSSGAPGAARALGLHFHAVGPKAPAPHRPRRR